MISGVCRKVNNCSSAANTKTRAIWNETDRKQAGGLYLIRSYSILLMLEFADITRQDRNSRLKTA